MLAIFIKAIRNQRRRPFRDAQLDGMTLFLASISRQGPARQHRPARRSDLLDDQGHITLHDSTPARLQAWGPQTTRADVRRTAAALQRTPPAAAAPAAPGIATPRPCWRPLGGSGWFPIDRHALRAQSPAWSPELGHAGFKNAGVGPGPGTTVILGIAVVPSTNWGFFPNTGCTNSSPVSSTCLRPPVRAGAEPHCGLDRPQHAI